MSELSALIQVILVDLLFAGDNAIAVGLVAAGVAPAMRTKVIALGIIAAVILRIIFALLTVWLLRIPGVLIIGGLLLLWVSWKLYQGVIKRSNHVENETSETAEHLTFNQALLQIIVADVSMSLDNVLAVAGIARDHIWILVFGLMLSVALMLVAATMIAKALEKYVVIGYIGIAILLYVSISMIWEGYQDLGLQHLL